MSKDLQENSNIKLQVSFKKVLELLDNGNLYIESINEVAGGQQLDALNKDDLYARNKITLNLTLELHKLPGMENSNSSVGNLVNSTVMDPGSYYSTAVNTAMADLKDASAVFAVLNQFLASKVDALLGEVLERGDAKEARAGLAAELGSSACLLYTSPSPRDS